VSMYVNIESGAFSLSDVEDTGVSPGFPNYRYDAMEARCVAN